MEVIIISKMYSKTFAVNLNRGVEAPLLIIYKFNLQTFFKTLIIRKQIVLDNLLKTLKCNIVQLDSIEAIRVKFVINTSRSKMN